MATFLNSFTSSLTLTLAKNRQQVYKDFLQLEQGCDASKLAILDQGIDHSPYKNQLSNYAERMTQRPELSPLTIKAYPNLGEMPGINEQGLNFLHPDIQQACVCIGGASTAGTFKGYWLGRNSLDKAQFWSTTKILPILNILCTVNEDIRSCQVKGEQKSFNFTDLVEDVFTYQEKIGTSNAIAAMFKRFQTYPGLEEWLIKVTGNSHTEFRGLYGEVPLITMPQIINNSKVLLSFAPEVGKGENSITAYDMARMMSMVGYHYHLPSKAQLPGLQWDNLKAIIAAFGQDTARYIDMALERLGVQKGIQVPVILSKMGYGYSDLRRRTELTYTAFTQFNFKGKLLSVTLALRGAKALGDPDQEAIEIDARMAAEVTEILRRLITGELLQ